MSQKEIDFLKSIDIDMDLLRGAVVAGDRRDEILLRIEDVRKAIDGHVIKIMKRMAWRNL